MALDVPFEDYDDLKVYQQCKHRATLQETLNFVVEFGQSQASVAFDLEVQQVGSLIKTAPPPERPVRWINLWGPHLQKNIVDCLGEHYDFSSRLSAIIKTNPPETKIRTNRKHGRPLKARLHIGRDVEAATTDDVDEKEWYGRPLDEAEPPRMRSTDVLSHYALAQQMINYQSFDVGTHYTSVGANFKHDIASELGTPNLETMSEDDQQRLWSWLIILDDHTVLSIQEYPGIVEKREDRVSFRQNTLSVLDQLSNIGHRATGVTEAISLQTVRQAMKKEPGQGKEGSSLLFYYLFDDWQAVYMNVVAYSTRLKQFHDAIVFDMWKKSYQTPDVNIIPRLHLLGRLGRQYEHLYSGYKSLVQRILDTNAMTVLASGSSSQSDHASVKEQKAVILSQSATQRFERLKDRLELLIIAQMKESLAEREALVTTYFNINAQKDSEATARLTRSATLLAKLSVLFLPVSLMTSYFSIQVSDLEGVYTAKDYWYAFAGIMSISFVALFFFSRLLMWMTETADRSLKKINHASKTFFANRLRKKRQ